MAEAQKVKVSAREVEIVPIKVGETIVVDATFLDANDNIAPVDGMPVWTSSNPAILDVQSVTRTDGATASCTAIQPGEAEAVCYADADMSAGVRNIAGRLAFSVTSLEAQKVVLTPRA